jgi:hypothetical protein
MSTESNKRQAFHDVALDFPSVAANTLESLTAAAPNAVVGSACLVVPPAALLTAGVASQGTLTIAEPVTDGDEFTIDTTVYTLKTTPAAAYDIAIGADEAATKVNIVAAINASGTAGVEYFAGTLIHPTVTATTFLVDDCVLTAKTAGVAGDSIVTAETGQGFTHISNVFDGATLGTTTAGVDPVASNLTFDGIVTAADVVTVRAINVTAAAVDAASGVFRIVLWS